LFSAERWRPTTARNASDAISSIASAQVAVTGRDTLLEVPGVGTVTQEIGVVVGLDAEKIDPGEPLSKDVGEDPGVGAVPETPVTVVDEKCDRFRGVVRRRHGGDLQRPDDEGLSGNQLATVGTPHLDVRP